MSKLNMQQLVKSHGFMQGFTPLPGCSLVYTDFNALEMMVATHFTKDASLMKLYGLGAKPHDAHCFNAANIKMFSERITQYYDIENPTKEGIALVKLHYGDVRDIIKMVGYALSYGAQPANIYAGLNQAGYEVTLAECQQIFNDYWRLYSGIKRFETQLLELRAENGGWILNGRGRPLCVPDDLLLPPAPPDYRRKVKSYKKDIYNRFIQSTGHDILMKYIQILARLRQEREIAMVPWLVDLHDSTTWQVRDDHVELAKKAFADAYVELNSVLNWSVQIKGDVKIGKTLAGVAL